MRTVAIAQTSMETDPLNHFRTWRVTHRATIKTQLRKQQQIQT